MTEAIRTNVPLLSGRLLIVDDEPDLLEILQDILKPVISDITVAENGKVALDIFNRGEIDVILSDINMPVMDGFTLLTEIRKQSPLVPFVILTAYGDKKNLLEAIRLNATDFLDKPFSEEEVRKVMKRALDFGVNLKKLDKELELLFDSSDLPAEEIARKKLLKRILFGMEYAKKTD
jgi:YesN/AraC family two-component response regulator